MKLYKSRKIKGHWHFDNSKGIYDYENSPYAEILDVLKIVLEELVKSKMLIPKKINGIESDLEYGTVEELIGEIFKSNLLENTFEFDITGDTIIYTNTGEEIHSGIFEINSFRTFQQCFFILTKSDVWLPMAFDEDSNSFVWNIERYNLNYQRLPNVLNKIIELLNWESFTAEVEYNELGTLQVKSDLFLNEEIITREFNSNPNTNFNLINYISKVSKSQI